MPSKDFLMIVWFFISPKKKNMHSRLIGVFKLPTVCECGFAIICCKEVEVLLSATSNCSNVKGHTVGTVVFSCLSDTFHRNLNKKINGAKIEPELWDHP